MRSVLLAAVAALLLFATSATAQENPDDIPLEVEQNLSPMDWDLGEEASFAPAPESADDSVPYSHVANVIACDLWKGCDGHGDDLQPLYPLASTVACNLEDNIECTSIPWYELEEYIAQYQDAGIVLTQGANKQIVIASN